MNERIRVFEPAWEVCDDVGWTNMWVGLSHGDLYAGDKAFGYYVAAWYPNTTRTVQMLITAVNEEMMPALRLAMHCSPSAPENVVPVDPKDVPWGDGEGYAIQAAQINDFTRASDILAAGSVVVSEDPAIAKYLLGLDTRLCGHDA